MSDDKPELTNREAAEALAGFGGIALVLAVGWHYDGVWGVVAAIGVLAVMWSMS